MDIIFCLEQQRGGARSVSDGTDILTINNNMHDCKPQPMTCMLTPLCGKQLGAPFAHLLCDREHVETHVWLRSSINIYKNRTTRMRKTATFLKVTSSMVLDPREMTNGKFLPRTAGNRSKNVCITFPTIMVTGRKRFSQSPVLSSW